MERNQRKEEKVEFERDKEEDASIPFNCNTCGLSEHCHYFGKTPNFAKKQVRVLFLNVRLTINVN